MKKEAQTGLCDKWCKGCKHRAKLATGEPYCCYILDTGHLRPNPAGDGCQMHTRLSEADVRRRREGIVILKEPPKKTQPVISDEAIRDEASSGKSDEEIAEKYGVAPITIKKRRLRLGIYRAAPMRKNYQKS